MAMFKCKMCGGDLIFEEGATVALCEYCGTKQTLPRLDSEKKANLYDRANHFRRNNDFDKAMSIYEQILNEDSTDAEAYWSIVLCRYGIEYVEDPATHKRLPTVNRAQFTSIFADEDYKSALLHADTLQKSVYEGEAAEIDRIQRGILAISREEEPFDIFICYKETDDRGRRTPDSVLAADLYYQLTKEGYKVFFSRITLEDKMGTAFEPYIFAALNTAKIMVVLGTRPEYFNAVWVKNEWSRYLALIKANGQKMLIPAYKDMDPYDLPEEFSHLQALDMGRLGFMQDLIRGIKKIMEPLEEKPEARETVKETVVVQQPAAGSAAPLLKRGYMALEDEDWAKANEFFEQVLNIDPECGEAYFGEVLARAHLSTAEELIKKRQYIGELESEPLEACPEDTTRIEAAIEKYYVEGYLSKGNIRQQFQNFKRIFNSKVGELQNRLNIEQEYFKRDKLMGRAVRYSSGDFAIRIKNVQNAIFSSLQNAIESAQAADTANKQRIMGDYAAHLQKTEQVVEQLYTQAIQRQKNDIRRKEKEELERQESLEIAEKQALLEKQKIKRLKDRRKKLSILGSTTVAFAIVIFIMIEKVIIPSYNYKEAETLMATGKYQEAREAFVELGDYKDSYHRAQEAKNAANYVQAEQFLAKKDYSRAIAEFQALGDYKDASTRMADTQNIAYEQAKNLLSAGDYQEAFDTFTSLGGYQDSAECAKEADNHIKEIAFEKAKELLVMGNYQEAIDAFNALGNYQNAIDYIKEATYGKAQEFLSMGSQWEAINLFNELGDYRNAKQQRWAAWDNLAVRETISAGRWHIVAIKANGTVIATGTNDDGQCNVGGWKDIVAVSAGESHTVGLKADGTVIAVGSNIDGQCNVGDWKDIVSIAAGYYCTIGLKSDGTVIATGTNESGQCNVTDWADVIAISAGARHTVALKADGTVMAVGSYAEGRCDVSDWTNIVAISAGIYHTVGLKSNGTVVAAGSKENNKCNVGDWVDIIAISAAADHTVGLKADGTVVASGTIQWNNRANLFVKDWEDVVAISSGSSYSIGLKSDGTVLVAGDFSKAKNLTNIKLPK